MSSVKPDNSIAADLGRRIRERRKKLGMTQAQLCGDYMTRNMLSRIETGNANPSLETLLFISQKLKMPTAYFLCRDAKEEAEYTKTVRIKDARRMLSTGQYKKCVDLCSELPSDDDEVSFIAVNAEVLWAVNCFDSGKLSDCASHLASALTALDQTVYMYSELQSQIKFLKTLSSALIEGVVPSPDALPGMAPVFFSRDRFLYITALASKSFPADAISPKSIYKKHLEARILMEKGDYEGAFPLLQSVYTAAQDSFCLYFTVCDLEETARNLEDFKAAYEYARLRMELHGKYSG